MSPLSVPYVRRLLTLSSRIVLATALIVLGAMTALDAQAPGATLTGVVSDESGAAVPHVDLTLADAATGVQLHTVSNDQGVYVFAGVPAGRYVLLAGGRAFAPVRLDGIVLTGAEQRSLAVTLKVSPLAETVSVTAGNAFGEQVARRSTVGVLGALDFMNMPFSQNSYTSRLIESQQTRYVSDVVANDPAVSVNSGASNSLDDFTIRGFNVSNTEILFNGMQGVAPSFYNSMMSEGVERVDVLKGPNALLNGNIGSLGGSINVVPKRAGEAPLLRFTVGHISGSQFSGHVDAGRRFGRTKAFGVRVNAVRRGGDGPIDHYSRKSILAAVGLDYRIERLRVSADLGYQEQRVDGGRCCHSIADGIDVPQAPDNHLNSDSPFNLSHPKVFYGMLRGELDLTSNWTVHVAAGGNQRRTQFIDLLSAAGTIINPQGDVADNGGGAYWLGADRMYQRSVETGLRGRFDTGPVHHAVVVAHSMSGRDWFRRSSIDAYPERFSNIHAPRAWPEPDFSMLPSPDDAGRHHDQTLSSIAVADILSILDDRLQVTLGARRQEIEQTSYNNSTGARTGGYENDAITHMAGVVVRPWQSVSIYGNYIQGLQPGSIVGDRYANAGETFAPYETEQYESGVKFDFGRFATTVGAYQIAQPSAIWIPVTNILSVDGEQRNRGLELNAFGEVARGVRLLGGLAYTRATLTRTQEGLNDGKPAVGVPRWRTVLGAEWDLPFVPGLTVTHRVIHNAAVPLDTATVRRLPNWTRLDLGARYRLNETVVVHANIDNALDNSYWISRGSGYFGVNDPRTFSLSASLGF